MHTMRAETTLFPYGVSTQAEVISMIRSECVEEDVKDLGTILSEWREASSHFQQLVKTEVGVAESVRTEQISEVHKGQVESITSDYLFQQSFSMLPIELKLVEIGKLVAAQRFVNLDYVEKLKSDLPEKPEMKDLIGFCLSPKLEQLLRIHRLVHA